MKLRPHAALLIGSVALCGCSFIFPESVLPNETVRIESSVPAAGTRVAPGTRVELRVKYRIEPFIPTQPYYLLACDSDHCKTQPEFAKRLIAAKGTEDISFVLTGETTYVMVVTRVPVHRSDCTYNVHLCTSSNSLGSDVVMLRLDADAGP